MYRNLTKQIKDINLYETIRSLELAYDYKFNNQEILNIINNYYSTPKSNL